MYTMLTKATSIQIDTLERLSLNKVPTQTYRQLITQLKQYYTMVQLKEILCISEATHNRYLNESDCPYSLKLQLYLLLQYHNSIPI